MPEQPPTPDALENVRGAWEAARRGDIDALMSYFPADAVWDASNMGIGVYEGTAAIRGLLVDWFGNYDGWDFDLEELRDLGNGVALAVVRQEGRPLGSSSLVQAREAFVYQLAGRWTVRIANYRDIDQARADAEALAGLAG